MARDASTCKCTSQIYMVSCDYQAFYILLLESEVLLVLLMVWLAWQGKLFKGAALFAPMLSLERASQHGLNYYLRCCSKLQHFGLIRVLSKGARPVSFTYFALHSAASMLPYASHYARIFSHACLGSRKR